MMRESRTPSPPWRAAHDASVPVVSAAAMLRLGRRLPGLKIVLIEPNALPGVANRALSRAADEVWGAYADTAVYFPGKFVKTGIPVRPAFYNPLPKADARGSRAATDSGGKDPRDA